IVLRPKSDFEASAMAPGQLRADEIIVIVGTAAQRRNHAMHVVRLVNMAQETRSQAVSESALDAQFAPRQSPVQGGLSAVDVLFPAPTQGNRGAVAVILPSGGNSVGRVVVGG